MYNINDIADYIILNLKSEDDSVSLVNLKLQKLLYYIQAWYYGIEKKPFFNDEFQAWVHGPVNRLIYDRFKNSKYLYSEINLTDVINKNPNIKKLDCEFINYILENYAQYSGAELERLSHSELPWKKTRGQLDTYTSSESIISSDLMINYYGEKWQKINK